MAFDIRATILAVALFCRCQGKLAQLEMELTRLGGEVERQASAIRQYQTEQVTMHEQVRKWMRRAVAAERVVESSRAEEPVIDVRADLPQPRGVKLWGARARRAQRVLRSDPLEETAGETAEAGGD